MAARRGNSFLVRLLVPPLVVICGVLALWENEGRFDYHAAARKARVVTSAEQGATADSVALTGDLDTAIAVPGEFVEQFPGYLVVDRRAEIYSWNETRRDNRSEWKQGWYGSLQNNSRNRALNKTLSSRRLLPPRYTLDELEIAPAKIHFVDDWTDIDTGDLDLSGAAEQHGLRKSGLFLYKGAGGAPALGDERVSYEGVPSATPATYFGRIVAGEAVGKQFEISRSFLSGLIRNDGMLHHLVKGERDEALDKMASHLQKVTWIVRGAGTLAIVAGIYFFFSGFVNLLYQIPLLGSLVSAGVLVVSLVLGLTLSLLVIVSSLLAHNPLTLALPLIVIIACVVVFRRRANTARDNVRESLDQELAQRSRQRATEVQQSLDAKLASMSSAPPPAPTKPAFTVEDTFVNLARLALADGDLDRREQKYLVRWGTNSGIAKERMKELFARAKRDGATLDATHRDDLVPLVCVAMADGTLSLRELSRLNGFAKRLGIPEREVRRIIKNVESRQPAPA